MKQEALSYYQGGDWSTLAMLLFLAVFLGVCGWVYLGMTKKYINTMSQFPLEDDEHEIR